SWWAPVWCSAHGSRRSRTVCATWSRADGTATSGRSPTGRRRDGLGGARRREPPRPRLTPVFMSRYLLRRILILLPVLAGISVVLFTILALAPGDPFEELATNPNVPPEVRMNLRAKFGLDDPLPVRYVRWLVSMLRGDWGFSFVSRVDVDTLILQRLPATLLVLGAAQLLAILVAIPIGTYSALRPYSIFDQIATTLAFIG